MKTYSDITLFAEGEYKKLDELLHFMSLVRNDISEWIWNDNCSNIKF